MAENFHNKDQLTGWKITQENYKGNTRYFVVESKAIFKTIRVEGKKRLFIELFNELVCNLLAKHLSIPVVTTFLGVMPSKGLGLFSIMLGETPFDPENKEFETTISNYKKLKELFVFDQWIYNDDRKIEHIMIGSDEGVV